MVILNFRPHEDLEFHIAALNPPAWQHLRQPLCVNDEHDLQEQPVLVEPARSNNEAAMGEGAVAPDVPAEKSMMCGSSKSLARAGPNGMQTRTNRERLRNGPPPKRAASNSRNKPWIVTKYRCNPRINNRIDTTNSRTDEGR